MIAKVCRLDETAALLEDLADVIEHRARLDDFDERLSEWMRARRR